MRGAVQRAIAGQRIDVAWASSVALAPFVTALRVHRIVDLVDVDSEKWREFAGHAGAPLRWAYALEARRLAQCEGRAAACADRLLLVSDIEADCLRRRLPAAPVSVVPNGVDTEYFTPASDAAGAAEPGIVFVGALDYRPNVDAVLFFLDQVWPALRARLPAATFTAVGHRPSAGLQAAARRAGAGVRVAGSVADVRPYLHAAAVFAAPLRFGRGTKNKVLEAMAAGVPVVASRVAVDGLAVRDGSDVLLAETAGEHADALFALLRDAPRRRALAASALDYVRRSHRWDQLLRDLDACLESVVRGAQVK
jgi:polysaccharide biosynthesis protein PslH